MKKFSMVAMVVVLLGSCLAAFAVETFTNTNVSVSYSPATSKENPVVAVCEVSFVDKPMASGDILVIGSLPKGGTIANLMYDIVTTNTPSGANTVDIGVVGALTQFKSNASLAATGPLSSGMTLYTAAAAVNITITADEALVDGVLRVWYTYIAPPAAKPTQGTTP